jgi:hypothetical protein
MTDENFIDLTAETIQLRSDDMDVALAYTSAHTFIGSVTGDKIFVRTYKGDLSADIMSIPIAESGTDKTGAHDPVENTIKEMELLIPANFTTESLPFYFDKKKYKTVEGKDGKKEKVEDGYFYKNYGLIAWDEASGQFAEAENKKHKAGTIELLSCVYNHKLKAAFLKDESRNVDDPQKPYISLLGNMVPIYFPKIPEKFFTQGIAGRIHWTYVPPQKPKPLDQQPDWNDLTNYNKSKNNLTDIKSKLIKLEKMLQKQEIPIIVLIDDEANILIKKFKYDTEVRWFTSLTHNPYGWDYQYFKRLAEMACKAALRYAIGDNVENITKLKVINKGQMKRGIQFAIQSSKALEQLFTLRQGFTSTTQDPKTRMKRSIVNAKNRMLNNNQWRKASGISSPNEFQDLRTDLIKEGLVTEVNKQSITKQTEIDRLRVNTATKIYRWIG